MGVPFAASSSFLASILPPPPSRLAFGSCNDHLRTNALWGVIRERHPAGFIWGGDAIYGDLRIPTNWSTFPPTWSHFDCATPQRLQTYYQTLKANQDYQALVSQTNMTVFGTYDDHDYGCNNADQTYQYRDESMKEFVKFLDLSPDTQMYQRAHQGKGVYGVQLYDFGQPNQDGGVLIDERIAQIDPDWNQTTTTKTTTTTTPSLYNVSNFSVAVFVLDCRSNKSPWKQGAAAYTPDLEGDFLGGEQWQWFETAVQRSPATINIVVNGLQVHSELFPNGNIHESWSQYPRSQQRLYNALLQSPGIPLLITGDVHMAQLTQKDCARGRQRRHTRSIVELTTSGMTHSWGTFPNPTVGKPTSSVSWSDRYASFVARIMMWLLHQFCPWTSLIVEYDSSKETTTRTKQGLQFSLEKNFGEVEFDWAQQEIIVSAIGESGEPLIRTTVPMRNPTAAAATAAAEEDGDMLSSWKCVNYRGRVNAFERALGHFVTGIALVCIVPFPLVLPAYVAFILSRKKLALRRAKHDSLFLSR